MIDDSIQGDYEEADEFGEDIGVGSICWNDQERLCGPDCIAFNRAYTELGESPCKLLSYLSVLTVVVEGKSE